MTLLPKYPLSGSPIRVLSLFSGGGGLDIGFRLAGFRILASNEIHDQYCRSLSENSEFFGKEHQAICGDIANFEPKKYEIGDVDFVIGGPPCQSFSAAGRRAGGVYGINDLRGSLFWHYCRILKEVNPKGFLFENVRGILSANSRSDWETIVQSFEDVGYKLFFRVLDAAEFGVPQHRERVIMVGIRHDCADFEFQFPAPTHGPHGIESSGYISASYAIRDIQDTDEVYRPYGGKYEECLKEIPPGLNYLYFTEKMGHPSPLFAWRSRFSDFLYVADPEKPTKTIVAHPGKWAGPFHWKKRKFTIAELKRLFTFPDDYRLSGSELVKIAQLGNSVPPRLAYVMALAVKQQLFKADIKINTVDSQFVYAFDKRKAAKAKTTKRRVLKNSEFTRDDQLELFSSGKRRNSPKDEFQEYYCYKSPISRSDSRAKVSSRYVFEYKLSEGAWAVKVIGPVGEGGVTAKIHLIFHRMINNAFNQIVVEGEGIHPDYVTPLWDGVDACVSRSTTYDSVQKLYGHFTEPYPQFKVIFEGENQPSPVFQLAKAITEDGFVGSYHDASIIQKILGVEWSLEEIVVWLRSLGFDIRTNATNRAINVNQFRICYPFTISKSLKTFTRITSAGMHKTADKTSIPMNL